MKALLIPLVVLLAGSLPAQSPRLDPWSLTQIGPPPSGAQIVLRPQDTYILRGARFTLDGVGVEMVKADNSLRLFDPFDENTLATARDNVVWDPNTPGHAIGINFFSIHF